MDNLLLQIADQNNKLKKIKLSAFAPLKGLRSTGELMIIGRAVNGWDEGWLPEINLDLNTRRNNLKRLFKQNENTDECPMKWVECAWGRETSVNDSDGKAFRYNTKRSAFWRVIKRITEGLNINRSTEWPSHLIWSNLYKVSPHEGGNPDSSLIKLQQDMCNKLLALEISEWKPKRILLLTGLNWAQPFIDNLGIAGNGKSSFRYVEKIGKYSINTGQAIPVVVSKHPQGKNENRLIDEVMAAFAISMD